MKNVFSCWVLFLGLLLQWNNAYACNACGCNFTNIQADQQLKKSRYSLALVHTSRWLDYQSSEEKSFSEYNYPSIIQQIQSGSNGHSHFADRSYYQEYRNDMELRAHIYWHDKSSIGIIAPFRQAQLFREGSKIDQVNGMGDPVVVINYHPIDFTGMNQRSKTGHRFTLGSGMEIPLGKYSIRGYENEVVPAYQPGSGSFDFIFLGNYLLTLRKFGWFNYLAFKLNTKNPNGFKFSNTMNVKSSVFLNLMRGKSYFIPQVGLELQKAGADELNGEKFTKDSGGLLMMANFGMEYFFKNYGLNFKYSYPLYQKLNGEQFEYQHQLQVGIRFLINKKTKNNELNN